ncbi:hypothetical protein [Bacillus sp. AFS017336]|uniref:hypothetical protein n=1 Tax=Bacillus sp. AFS017336 TaxID=2033489 RepID=UPI000BF0F20D|nr:hypothetical protein [Bacillus sp. AFS017336]PEK99587.1 hypothetical protein CN601_23425 [Bacillus sp. AFS017336]
MKSNGLTFGIYPLSVAGTPIGLATGPEDNYEKISSALKELKGNAKQLLPRMYAVYMGPETEEKVFNSLNRYKNAGLLGDLTIGCLMEQSLSLEYWLNFVRKVIKEYGPFLESIQITNEPNLSFMDGSKPYVFEALVQGILIAKEEITKNNLKVKIGFGSVPEGEKTIPHFWENLMKIGGDELIHSIDYVGHNFYVDVFEEPLEIEEIAVSVENILRKFRETLNRNGFPTTLPIHITENGWPTGKNPFIQIERSYAKQSDVLEKVVRTVYALRQELNITHYEFFGLRDADSSKDDLFHQFGIMKDDYSPKPAFYTYQKLVNELSK